MDEDSSHVRETDLGDDQVMQYQATPYHADLETKPVGAPPPLQQTRDPRAMLQQMFAKKTPLEVVPYVGTAVHASTVESTATPATEMAVYRSPTPQSVAKHHQTPTMETDGETKNDDKPEMDADVNVTQSPSLLLMPSLSPPPPPPQTEKREKRRPRAAATAAEERPKKRVAIPGGTWRSTATT